MHLLKLSFTFLWCRPEGCLCRAAVMLLTFCSQPRGTLLQGPSWGTRWTPVGSFPLLLRSSRCYQMWVHHLFMSVCYFLLYLWAFPNLLIWCVLFQKFLCCVHLTLPPHVFQDMPYSKSQFKKCAVIGNGGIIKNSKCGKEIDSADFVFRYSRCSLLVFDMWELYSATWNSVLI